MRFTGRVESGHHLLALGGSTAGVTVVEPRAQPTIPLFKVAMSPLALNGIAEVLRSGQIEHGPKVQEFEEAVGRLLGNPRVVAVSSGTSGLHLALRLAAFPDGAMPGDRGADEAGEVLSVPLTFEATNWAIFANRLRLRWVDVDPDTLSVDFADLERKISPVTRAIMVVHWLGFPVDLQRLTHVLDRAETKFGFRPVVVEDAAQAWGATYQGLPLGNHGNLSVFSLGAIKLLTSGSGGLVVLPEDALHQRARLLRWFGIDRAADRGSGGYDVAEWGYKFTMNDIAAAIGLRNLDIVEDLLRRTRDNASFYDQALADVPGLTHIERVAQAEPSFWAYPLKVADRPAFIRKLTDAGIATSIIARRNDAHTCAADAASDALPGLDDVYDLLVYIPVGWWLSESDRIHVADTIRSGW
jgi:dTDP-4-amino-4,6-dideoxy-D-glucose/dTDP-4-amino-2,4-dideoxy-beta-L-xylose transaminase